MAVLFLVVAILAVLLGFVGIIIIIKGFVDKSNKKIQMGTILVCIMLILAVSGAFCIGKRAINSKRYHDNQRSMMIDKCMKECGPDMMKDGCPGMNKGGCGMPAEDTVEQKIVTKIIVN